MTIKQTAGRDALGTFAPEFAHFNDDILFGENWNSAGVDLKTRSLITVVALMAQGITDSSLAYHIANAKSHGVSRQEMAAAITHTAFYAGWPKAWATFNLAKGVYTDEGEADTPEFEASADDDGAGSAPGEADAGGEPDSSGTPEPRAVPSAGSVPAAGGVTDPDSAPDSGSAPESHGGAFGLGEPNDAFAQYFTGQSYLKQVSAPGDYLPIFNVTFEPGCRNNWHIHHASQGGGQVLICVDGRGWYQEEGKPARALKPGDVVEIPANVKHWHGAAADSWFSHLAFEYPGENASNEWCEPVSDEAYAALDDACEE